MSHALLVPADQAQGLRVTHAGRVVATRSRASDAWSCALNEHRGHPCRLHVMAVGPQPPWISGAAAWSLLWRCAPRRTENTFVARCTNARARTSALAVATLVALATGRDAALIGGAVRVQRAWSRAVLHGLALVAPSPLGWKLEPRLASAMQAFIALYVRQYTLVFRAVVAPNLVVPVIALGATLSLWSGHARPLLAAAGTVAALAALVLLLLAWLLLRASRNTVTLLRSLLALFRGRLRSTLRHREEPLQPSLDTLLLGLLLGAAAALLAPVLAVHCALLVVATAPFQLAWL